MGLGLESVVESVASEELRDPHTWLGLGLGLGVGLG